MRYDSIVRERERATITGISKSSWYRQLDDGLAVPPIKLGRCSVGYPREELIALNAARVAGKSEEELRGLVRQLIAGRARALEEFESVAA